jgi:tetratricopeptide (TPR) repeat protein
VAFSRYAWLLAPVLLAAGPVLAQPPAPDQASAVDAEVRVALFDLLSERPLAALSRLRALHASGQVPPPGPQGTYGAAEIQFLLAESYNRLGMANAFRGAAFGLLESGNTRYAPVLRLQLLLDAYRRGAYQDAVSLAGEVAAQDRGIASLVAGLAHYRLGSHAAAQQAFTAAAQSGGAYGGYARYMGALAQMAGDTAQAQAAIAALQALSGDALGDFADQVNLTIAQLAYQRGQYDVATAAAARVSESGGLVSQAMLTRAWSLYKSSQLEPAAQAFTAFATRFPELPQRDEARLMVGQVLLQQGRIDDAGRHFQRIADSLSGDVEGLRQDRSGAVSEAARAFVRARAATMLFLQAPTEGKTLSVPDNLGMDQASIAQALGSAAPVTPPEQLRPEIVALDDVAPRLDSIAASAGPAFPRRVAYVFDAGGATRTEFLRRSQALREADVTVALARYRLAEQLASHNAKLALIERLQVLLGEAASRLDTVSTELTAARDSLSRVVQAADEEHGRLRELIQREASAVATEAAENVRRADSVRASVGEVLTPDDANLMRIERETALTYQRMAENVMSGLDRAFARHPVMRLRDTVRAHIAESEALVTGTRSTIAETNDLLASEVARMRATETERTAAARAAVASAEAARATAEGAVVVAVEAELRARAEQLLTIARRDTEAAEFGAASASFLKAVGPGTAATPGQGPGGAGGSGAPSPE